MAAGGTSSIKTRATSGTKIGDYLGSGKALLPSELPTLRSILRQGVLFKEEKVMEESNRRTGGRTYSYGKDEVVTDMIEALKVQWQKSNADFKPPVVISDQRIKERLKDAWEIAEKIAQNKSNVKQRKKIEDKLDKLFDIIKCSCPIVYCSDKGCPENCRRCEPCGRCENCITCTICLECNQGAHISCSCPREAKIPILELRFILAQRKKTGEKSEMMITKVVDKEEQTKVEKKLKRENEERERAERKQEKERMDKELLEAGAEETLAELEEAEEGREEEVIESEEEIIDNFKEASVSKSHRNMVELTGLASTAIRYGASSRMTGALATSFLGDLIRADILPPEAASLAVDGAKVQRAKEKLMGEARERGEERMKADTPSAIMIDSRIDRNTKVLNWDEETKKFFPGVEAQDHYTVTDGDGKYLHHFTKEGKPKEIDTESSEDNGSDEETVEIKPSEAVARILFEWMETHGIDMTLTHLGADSTNSNTGWRRGIIAWLEKLSNKKLVWLICMLHTNELGLRRLIQKLDGKTSSKTGFTGPLGKLLAKVNNMEPNYDFKKIDIGPDPIDLPTNIQRDLSWNQKTLHLRWKAVKTGQLTRDVGLTKAGPIVHSRWLTTADSILKLYMSKHKLEGVLLERLETIVTYIVTIYCPMWFEIKRKHSWLEGPRHILKEVSLFRRLSPEVQKILEETLRRSAWNSHSEAVLQTMVCSDDKEEREFAVATILKIRGRNKLGNRKQRSMKLPTLNMAATQLKDLIDWKGAREPVLTCSLTKDEVKGFKEKPMEVPYYCLHTQGIERAVKEVTSASEIVYGFERRDGFIRGRTENRSLMPSLTSKKALMNLLV